VTLFKNMADFQQFIMKIILGLVTVLCIYWVTGPILVFGAGSYYVWKYVMKSPTPFRRSVQTPGILLLIWFVIVEAFWFRGDIQFGM
jgi:hypothetical protein